VDRTNDPCGRFGARAPAMPPPPVVPNVRFCACLGPRATTDPLGFDPKPEVPLRPEIISICSRALGRAAASPRTAP